MDDFTLNDGRAMPRFGMGTWQIPDGHAAAVVRAGLDLGYRLVDTPRSTTTRPGSAAASPTKTRG